MGLSASLILNVTLYENWLIMTYILVIIVYKHAKMNSSLEIITYLFRYVACSLSITTQSWTQYKKQCLQT